jgi:Uma2 family endonuclease
MTTAHRLMTAEELDRLPRDGRSHRLRAGVLFSVPPRSKRHGKYAMRLSIPLGAWVYAHGLGEIYTAETGFLLGSNPDDVQAPDLAFATREHADQAEAAEGPYFPGGPDLAVEVISPNDTYAEVDETVSAWLAAGTGVVVVINPRRRRVSLHRPGAGPGEVAVTTLTEAETLSLPDLFPGWSLPVAAIFAPEPPRA